MLHRTVSSLIPDPRVILEAVGVLQRGGIVAFPTDTFYGLAVDPRRDDAVERLFALKGRHGALAVPLIASDVEQALAAGALQPADVVLADVFWPGPLSIVVPARPVISRAALGAGRTVAVRVPDQAVARALAAAFGFCITATSANLSGASAATTAAEVVGTMDDASHGGTMEFLILDAGPSPGGAPSTIVELRPDGPALLRAGAIAWERVLKSLR